jgi:all-trans-8'-apo-beta-carotenal 15,15'-oxygenase
MQRRAFMQFLSATALAAPGVGISRHAFALDIDPLKACAERFSRNRKDHGVLAGWQSMDPAGSPLQSASLKGQWPEALKGTLYRNGPGLFERGGQRYLHWFDGDGLVQAWKVTNKRVTHHARFVQTPKFKRENKSNRFEVMAAGTTIANARAVSGPDDANTANISVLHLNGKTYALWEAGSAFEIDRDTLETKQMKTWRDDLEGMAFSAHPVYDADGSIWNVGALGDQIVVYHVSADGELLQAQLIKLPRAGYMHSFTATESKLVFVFAPLVRVRDAGSFFEGLGWRPEQGSLMVVLPKNALDQPQYLDFEAGAAYHYADAWDGFGENGKDEIFVRACWNRYEANQMSSNGFISPLQHYMQGYPTPKTELHATLTTLHANLKTKKVQLLPTDLDNVEFPIQTRLTRQSPLLLPQGKKGNPLKTLSGLTYVDKNAKVLGHYDFGPHCIIEEQLYVPAGGKHYALGTVFDTKAVRTGLVAFDLSRISDGPIAQAWLENAMPLGFHGSFLAAG